MADVVNIDIKLKEFDLNNIAENSAILVIAPRGSGKSWICRSLLNNFKNIPAGIIISCTESSDPFYSKFFPDSFIYDMYSPDIMTRIMKRQYLMKEK